MMGKRKKFDFIPEVLRDAAYRFDRLGYKVSYVNEKSTHHGSMYLKMHVLEAKHEDTKTRIRIKIHTSSEKATSDSRGVLEMEGSLVIQGYGSAPLRKIETIGGLWRFAQLNGLCWCGKIPFTEQYAEENLRRALVRRVIKKKERRQEIRKYFCESWGGVWHMTSKEYYSPVPCVEGET